MSRLSLRIAVVLVSAALVVSPASADCNAYECRRTVDTAECWIRYGPNSHLFRRGAECTVGRNCSWFFNEGEWDTTCYYDRNISLCYDV